MSVANKVDLATTETCLPIMLEQGSKNIRTLAILDTGAQSCIMPARLAGDHLKPSTLKLTAANGTTIPILGTRRMHFSVAGFRLSALFCVTDAVDKIILSRPWLAENEIQWNCVTVLKFVVDMCNSNREHRRLTCDVLLQQKIFMCNHVHAQQFQLI
jgi:hypothetical protein